MLFGFNGVGKMILISIICGFVCLIGGSIYVGGFDVLKEYWVVCKFIGFVL